MEQVPFKNSKKNGKTRPNLGLQILHPLENLQTQAEVRPGGRHGKCEANL